MIRILIFVSLLIAVSTTCINLIDHEAEHPDALCYFYDGEISEDGWSVKGPDGVFVKKNAIVVLKENICIRDPSRDLTGLTREKFFQEYLPKKNIMDGIFQIDPSLYEELKASGEYIDTGKFMMRTINLLNRLKPCRFVVNEPEKIVEEEKSADLDNMILECTGANEYRQFMSGLKRSLQPCEFEAKEFIALPVVNDETVATGTIVDFEGRRFIFTVKHANLPNNVVFTTKYGQICGRKLLINMGDFDIYLINETMPGMIPRITSKKHVKYRGYYPNNKSIYKYEMDIGENYFVDKGQIVHLSSSECHSFPGMSGSPFYENDSDQHFIYGMLHGRNKKGYCGAIMFNDELFDILSNYKFSIGDNPSCNWGNPSWIISVVDRLLRH